MKRIQRLLFASFLTVLLLGCEKGSPEPDFTQSLRRWESLRLTDYTIKQSLQCYCVRGSTLMTVTVRNNRISDVKTFDGASLPSDQWNQYRTVDELFTLIRDTNPSQVARVTATYDTRHGYPTSVYIDRSAAIADEEIGYETQDLDY